MDDILETSGSIVSGHPRGEVGSSGDGQRFGRLRRCRWPYRNVAYTDCMPSDGLPPVERPVPTGPPCPLRAVGKPEWRERIDQSITSLPPFKMIHSVSRFR